VIVINEDGQEVSVDPAFNPHTSVTPTVSSQGVGTEAAQQGETEPPLVTPTGSNLFFLQMPTNSFTATPMTPVVRVQVRDNHTGTPVPGVTVTLLVGNNPGDASLTGGVATSDELGIAMFPSLAVSAPGVGYTLVASVTADGVVATALSVPFSVIDPVVIAMPSVGERAARSGVPYALTLGATGGTAPYTWSIVGGELPGGLVLNPQTGAVSGTTNPAGPFTFTVQAQDVNGLFHTLTMCITVLPPIVTELSTTSVGAGVTLENLVRSLLKDPTGTGVTVSNIRLNGAPASETPYAGAGVFEGAASILGIERGIVLSSGAVSDSAGPNDSDSTGGFLGTGGDDDLTQLARESSSNPEVVTNDKTVLEFDFVPTSRQVSFRYVFGSEEYNEFVASQYNDAFGFFITGPNGVKINWARVPGTTQAVAINTINNGNPQGTLTPSNPHLYRNNDLSDGGGAIDIEADGLTVVLTLTANVTPGMTHTMKLAVADAGDTSYDSWVFIEGGSFRAVENCTNGVDDDGDGLADGMDPDCQVCPDLEPGMLIINVPATAGGTANTNGEPSGTPPIHAIALAAEETVTVTATGSVFYNVESEPTGPGGAGFAGGEASLAPALPRGALVARVGDGPWELVGAGPTVLQGGFGGTVEFAVNDSAYDDNAGAFTVTVQR
jgi:hypothetical protein